jgi:phospho-N-acetylmuramoyl-pentapeptide-transferase
MGGLGFLISITLSLLSASLIYLFGYSDKNTATSLIVCLIYAVLNSLIGIIDDLTKLRRKENAGLTPPQKLFMQTILAMLFLMARKHFFSDSTMVSLVFGKTNLGVFYYPIAGLILLGVVNCANLTDGIDGLASSVSATIGIVFFILGSAFKDTQIISVCLVAGAIGFLLFNAHPAKIFMGDTGSLFLGALAGCLSFSMKNPFIIATVGGVYVIEGLSVILQVAVFKITGRRIFKMAPIHHHLEKSGFDEGKICVIATISTLILSSLSFIFTGW